MKIRPFILTAFLALAGPALAVGQNVTVRHGVTPGGYDSVALQTEGKAVRGKHHYGPSRPGRSRIGGGAERHSKKRFPSAARHRGYHVPLLARFSELANDPATFKAAPYGAPRFAGSRLCGQLRRSA